MLTFVDVQAIALKKFSPHRVNDEVKSQWMFSKWIIFKIFISSFSRTLVSGADLLLSYGRRYGLIGRNGMGKTTLLRMLAGRQLQIPSHMTVLHVEQEVEGDDTEALESVLQCDTKRHDLLLEERQLTAQLQSAPR